MTNKTKIRPNDTRVLNDLENAPEFAKQYHDMNAANEAAKIAERYKHSPVYLRLLSMHIGGLADSAYSKHMRELEAQPRKRNPDNGQFMSEELFDNE